MSEPLTGVLALAAVGVGSLHTMAPDHWVPFAALARAQGWSRAKTIRVTAACGFGHVTVSVLLGVLALFFGLEVLRVVGERMEAAAGLLLIGFGVVYAVYGLRHASAHLRGHFHGHTHGHHHAHADHDHDSHRMTPWALFVLFSADPCVAVMPILFAAAPLGMARTALVVAAYELATIATMVVLVVPAAAAARQIGGRRVTRYGDAFAGAVIVSVGLFVAVVGW
jgi:putative Mn2+ efflux pump MntP